MAFYLFLCVDFSENKAIFLWIKQEIVKNKKNFIVWRENDCLFLITGNLIRGVSPASAYHCHTTKGQAKGIIQVRKY